MHSPRATATRIWKDEDTEQEYKVLCSFLWQDVSRLEGGVVEFQYAGPTTEIYLLDGSVLTVLGSAQKWGKRWDAYLRAEKRSLYILPSDN